MEKEKLREAFRCSCEGAGSAAMSHIGCVTIPVLAGAVGATVSHAALMSAMYVVSPLIAIGVTWGFSRYKGTKMTARKFLTSTTMALAVTFALGKTMSHSDEGHEHHHGNHSHGEVKSDRILQNREWFNQQTPEMRLNIIQSAEEINTSLDEYLKEVCGSTNRKSSSINFNI